MQAKKLNTDSPWTVNFQRDVGHLNIWDAVETKTDFLPNIDVKRSARECEDITGKVKKDALKR